MIEDKPRVEDATLRGLLGVAAEISAHHAAAGLALDGRTRSIIKLAGESGEFAEAAARYMGAARRSGSFEEMELELADVVITAFVAAVEFGSDLPAVILRKLDVIFSRGWRE